MSFAYIMRHGDARGELTERGREQVRASAEQIRNELEGIERIVIYHSPLTRAVQSAQVLQEALRPIIAVLEERQECACDESNIGSVVRNAQRPCIVVSHQPDIADFTGSSLGNAEFVKV